MSSKSIYKDIHFYSTELTRKINIVDSNFLQLYINIINMSSMIVDYPNNVYTENHHILPKSVFPEYKDCSWNIIKLTAYNHLMAHYYLHKAFNNAKFTHAFAQMKRVISNFEGKDLEDIAKLYEEERVRIRDAISESQTLYWKNLSDDELISKKKATSNFFKNKLVVKDKDGVIYHLDKSDPRILSGELVYHLTGTTKSDDTKNKISKSNSGTSWYYDSIENKFVLLRKNQVEPHHEKRYPDFIDINSPHLKDKNYYNPETNETRRLEHCPDGWVKGKTYFGENGNPFKDKYPAKNLLSGECIMITKGQISRWCVCGERDSRFLYVVENEYIGKYISTSLNRFAKIIESDYCVLKELESNKDKIISPRCKSKLIKQFKGKSYYDIGIKIVPLESQSITQLENIYAEFTWV